eukprot:4799970-Prorocentrum_lima.AAC.1
MNVESRSSFCPALAGVGLADVRAETPGIRCQRALGKEKGVWRRHMWSSEALVSFPFACGEMPRLCPSPIHLLSAEQ